VATRVDRRSPEAERYRKLYKTALWARIRKQRLTEQPLCERHLKRDELVPATVVHHVEAHKGDPVKFFGGPFESICKPCHDSDAQQEERIGYSPEIGADGWPTDPRHPFNKAS
jgi:hypothetical protein